MADIERKLATIRRIKDLTPIEKADAIETAHIDGWKVVVKKGDFKVGDLCIYFEIDSVLPPWPEFEFLASHKYRVKTIKLRGQVSQGLVFPLSLFNFEEGRDITMELGVTKYEPPIPECLAGKVRGTFPSCLRKTDEERIQNMDERDLEPFRSNKIIATEKLDGSSMTMALIDDEFHVCSRNMDLKKPEPTDTPNMFWTIAIATDMERKMRMYCKSMDIKDFAVQGELIGNTCGNPYKLDHNEVRLFYAFNIDKQEYLLFNEFCLFTNGYDLLRVPLIDRSNLGIGHIDVEELIILSEGKSQINPSIDREGIVYNIDEPQKRSFKVINNIYLLKEK